MEGEIERMAPAEQGAAGALAGEKPGERAPEKPAVRAVAVAEREEEDDRR
jgi:hypothetical protein